MLNTLNRKIMYYAVKDGKVNRHESSSSYRTVYSSSPKAVKAVLSPDEKNVLAAKDIAWDGNKSFQVQANGKWTKKSI